MNYVRAGGRRFDRSGGETLDSEIGERQRDEDRRKETANGSSELISFGRAAGLYGSDQSERLILGRLRRSLGLDGTSIYERC